MSRGNNQFVYRVGPDQASASEETLSKLIARLEKQKEERKKMKTTHKKRRNLREFVQNVMNLKLTQIMQNTL